MWFSPNNETRPAVVILIRLETAERLTSGGKNLHGRKMGEEGRPRGKLADMEGSTRITVICKLGV